jgi:hypothetical protein
VRTRPGAGVATWAGLALLVCAAPAAALGACSPGDLVSGATVVAPQGQPLPRHELAGEGSAWNGRGTIALSPDRPLVLQLATVARIGALVVQADDNDTYLVEGAFEADEWRPLWTVPVATGTGLRTRYARIDGGQPIRWLRVRPLSGDGLFSLRTLQAYCALPTPWPPRTHQDVHGGSGRLTQRHLDVIKGVLAVLGLGVVLWGIAVQRAGRPEVDRRLRDIALLLIGIASGLCWWNLGRFHFPSYLHRWEIYHYAVGAKYFRELGYTRLYECAVVADLEDVGPDAGEGRLIRNLESNQIEPATRTIDDPQRCKRYFEPERWEAFKTDAAFFRARMSPQRWRDAQQDHGYNGTPAWGILGTALANLGPASERLILALALLDPLLLVAMWCGVWWAFGWRGTCVAMTFWGTNALAPYMWNGGSFLRQDWLCASILGICLLRQNRPGWAGVALTYAALLRIFPGLIIVGLILKAVAHLWRENSFVLTRDHRRFALGCAGTLAVLVPTSAWIAGSWDAWPAFARNSRVHLATPLTNHMGLKTLLSYDSASRAERLKDDSLDDPFSPWKDARKATFAQRKALWWLAVGLYLALLVRAVSRQEDWVGACLAIGLIPIATELTSYYYSILLGMSLLWTVQARAGAALLALSATTCLLPALWPWYDDLFTWQTVAAVAWLGLVVVRFALDQGRGSQPASCTTNTTS